MIQIGQRVLAKVDGQVIECIVKTLGYEDIELIVDVNKTITRKYWEIRKIDNEKE